MKSRQANGGYAILVVFLGLGLFSFLMIMINFGSSQITSMVNAQTGWSSYYDPTMSSAMDMLLYPGLALAIMFGAVVEVIMISQKKSGVEDYI